MTDYCVVVFFSPKNDESVDNLRESIVDIVNQNSTDFTVETMARVRDAKVCGKVR